ncbi:MAG: type II secretion system F family protein, partial [Planctomycetota bacterium]
MPTFQYEALNASGKSQKGTIEASSGDEAIQRIKAQQLFPTKVAPAKSKKAPGAAAAAANAKKKKRGGGISIGGVSPKDLTMFTRQLSTLQDAGLPLLRSLQILESLNHKPRRREIVSCPSCGRA